MLRRLRAKREYRPGAPLVARGRIQLRGEVIARGEAIPPELLTARKHRQLWLVRKADHPQAEPAADAATDEVRLMVTPGEHVAIAPGGDGALPPHPNAVPALAARLAEIEPQEEGAVSEPSLDLANLSDEDLAALDAATAPRAIATTRAPSSALITPDPTPTAEPASLRRSSHSITRRR